MIVLHNTWNALSTKFNRRNIPDNCYTPLPFCGVESHCPEERLGLLMSPGTSLILFKHTWNLYKYPVLYTLQTDAAGRHGFWCYSYPPGTPQLFLEKKPKGLVVWENFCHVMVSSIVWSLRNSSEEVNNKLDTSTTYVFSGTSSLHVHRLSHSCRNRNSSLYPYYYVRR